MKTFGAIFRKRDQKHIEKHWVSHSNLMSFRDVAELHFSLGKIWFGGVETKQSKTVTKPVVYEDF